VRRAVHGVLLLDKPLGWSSNDALQKVKGFYRAAKAGHTGTLDPLATGLLPICFGAATKFAQASLDADKAYRATLALGTTTSTGDGEGAVTSERPVALDRSAIERACAAFTGALAQRAPMHSAVKHAGRALYDYARAGIDVERDPRRIVVHRIEIVAWHADRLVLDVACGKGTYLRSLAADIGAALGCGAHLAALRRTASGALSLRDAHTLAELEGLDEDARDALLLPADALLAEWPVVRLDDDDAGRFLAGLRRRLAGVADAPRVRVYARGAFLGAGKVESNELISTRLLSPLEVEALGVRA